MRSGVLSAEGSVPPTPNGTTSVRMVAISGDMSAAAAHEDADGVLIAIVAIIADMTELKQAEEQRRKLEQQMLHVQKLESLGDSGGRHRP
jgi:hypothetical protein